MKLKIAATVAAVAVLVIIFAIAFSKDHNTIEISDAELNNSVENSLDIPSNSETVSSEPSREPSTEISDFFDESEPPETEDASQENSEPINVTPPITSDSEESEESVESVPEDDVGTDFSQEASDEESADTETSEPVEPDISVPEDSETSNPDISVPDSSEPEVSTPVVLLTFEEYLALSPAEQQTYFESFPTIQDYIAWYNAAQKEYEDSQNKIEVSGDINIGDYVSSN